MVAALLLPFFLVFVGDAQVPIGSSAATVPIGLFLLTPILALKAAAGIVRVSRLAALLAMVLVAGVVGTALSPQAQALRATAGALPLVYALIGLLVYENTRLRSSRISDWMLFGGAVLAIWVILLGAPNIAGAGDYYNQKLQIETLLGRSNYLAAFLLFLVGLSWARSKSLALVFSFAIVCTMSRGGMAMLVLFIFSYWLAKRNKLWIIGLVALIILIMLLFLVGNYGVEATRLLFESSDETFRSTLNRLLIWGFGLELWTNQPLIGIGPNTFRTYVETADDVEDLWGVHNSILLMLLNYGILGALLYSIYLRRIYTELLRAEKVDHRLTSVRAIFVVLLVFSLFEPLVGSAAFELLLVLIYVLANSVANGRR